jgi:chromosome segregation ATPase
LGEQTRAANHFQRLLSETKLEFRKTKAEKTQMAEDVNALNKSTSELRDSNMTLQRKLKQAKQAKELAKQNAEAAVDAARDQRAHFDDRLAEKTKGRLQAMEDVDKLRSHMFMLMQSKESHVTGVSSMWQRSLDVRVGLQNNVKQLYESDIKSRMEQVPQLKRNLDEEKARTTKYKIERDHTSNGIAYLASEKDMVNAALPVALQGNAETSAALTNASAKTACCR